MGFHNPLPIINLGCEVYRTYGCFFFFHGDIHIGWQFASLEDTHRKGNARHITPLHWATQTIILDPCRSGGRPASNCCTSYWDTILPNVANFTCWLVMPESVTSLTVDSMIQMGQLPVGLWESRTTSSLASTSKFATFLPLGRRLASTFACSDTCCQTSGIITRYLYIQAQPAVPVEQQLPNIRLQHRGWNARLIWEQAPVLVSFWLFQAFEGNNKIAWSKGILIGSDLRPNAGARIRKFEQWKAVWWCRICSEKIWQLSLAARSFTIHHIHHLEKPKKAVASQVVKGAWAGRTECAAVHGANVLFQPPCSLMVCTSFSVKYDLTIQDHVTGIEKVTIGAQRGTDPVSMARLWSQSGSTRTDNQFLILFKSLSAHH